MNNFDIDKILKGIQEGKRCSWVLDEDEVTTIVSIEQIDNDLYTYTSSTRHKYDVVSPTHNDRRTLNEKELRTLLGQGSHEVFNTISYVYKEIINENTRQKVDLIYSYLRQSPKVVYVVFKEDRHETGKGEPNMHFNSLFKDLDQAEGMVNYLKKKQGATCYGKSLTLALKEGELELHGDLSQFDKVNSKQILATLLNMDMNKIAAFFEA